MDSNKKTQSWEDLIKSHLQNDPLKSCNCKIYNRQPRITDNDLDQSCSCGRLVRSHSFDGESLQAEADKGKNHNWKPPIEFESAQSAVVPVTIFGTLEPTNCKFIRLDYQANVSIVYNLLVDDCGGKNHKPALILSVYGGAKYYVMTEKLEKEIIRGIIDAATTADAWILTTGINNGVSKLVGEGISHYRLLQEDSNKVKCIGLTMWGTVSENTRLELKQATHSYPKHLIHPQIPNHVHEEKETIEKNHTHCILFHNGGLNEYLGDSQRHRLVTQACEDKDHPCYGVTIIIEGGTGTLEVLKNDIAARRPIVLIQGSGRLADVLASLIEQTSHSKQNEKHIPTEEDIKEAFYQFFPNPDELDTSATQSIQSILEEKNRYLLNVFSLDRDDDVAKTIFKAISSVQNKRDGSNNVNIKEEEKQNKRKQLHEDQDRLVDLALKWNYIDGVLPILQSRRDFMRKSGQEDHKVRLVIPLQMHHFVVELLKKEIERYKNLFRDSLEKNRPQFVEYFLAADFDLCALIEINNTEQRKNILKKLYNRTPDEMNKVIYFLLDKMIPSALKSHDERVKTLFGESSIKRVEKLDEKLNKFVGLFIGTIYSSEKDSYNDRVCIEMKNHVCTFTRYCTCTCCEFHDDKIDLPANHDDRSLDQNKNNESSYSKDELLRDLFLWSVFMDMPEMSKIILLHLPSRICAALIASAIFKRYAKASTTVGHKEKFQDQAHEFETYAGIFIDKCYEYNERLACELLLREIPLFGNVTCMQIAISSESKKLVGTSAFYQALNQVWYNKLSVENHQNYAKIIQIFTISSFGLLAPLFRLYQEPIERKYGQLSPDSIQCYIDKKEFKVGQCTTYWLKLKYFHESPMIKMCYHFISYIWFLIAFSYMMLYHLDNVDTFIIPHWTEIYVIITVSTMLCEEIRKLCHQYRTRMLERWGWTGSTLVTVSTIVFYSLPYFLFYLGLAFRYRAYNDDILTTARIIWAFDLELWYIKSLEFVVALKAVGPKLFMLKKMLTDLAAFVYMIFIAIVAYGVVSRALILYKQVPFTGNAIFKEIFYVPYWFMYETVSDKDLLDEKIQNGTASVVAEAKATHVLLAFHMLFVNILVLTLLIAVFTHTIDKVKENTEFYWRCQRYAFVREYFERPPFAYPPLILLPHLVIIFLALQRKCCAKLRNNQVGSGDSGSEPKSLIQIFKMIPMDKVAQNKQWNDFEDAATHSYVRSIVEKDKKNKGVLTPNASYSKSLISTIESDEMKSVSDEQQMVMNLNKEISTMKSVLNDNQKSITEIKQSLQWIMNAMARVKMDSTNEQPPDLKSLPIGRDIPESARITTNSEQ